MRNAECQWKVRQGGSTSHFNSAFHTPHSALLPHQCYRHIADNLE